MRIELAIFATSNINYSSMTTWAHVISNRRTIQQSICNISTIFNFTWSIQSCQIRIDSVALTTFSILIQINFRAFYLFTYFSRVFYEYFTISNLYAKSIYTLAQSEWLSLFLFMRVSHSYLFLFSRSRSNRRSYFSFSNLISYFSRLFFAITLRKIIQWRKIWKRCITCIWLKMLKLCDAVDSLKRKKHKKIIIYENMSWKSRTNSKRKWSNWQNKKKNSFDQKTNWKIYLSTLQKQYEIWQQYQVSRAYSQSTCEKVETICSAICWVRCFIFYFICFIFFRIEIFFVISIDNFLIFRVIEINSRVINYFFRILIRILVDCNITKIDILNRNRFTTHRCIQTLSSFDCDIQIDVQIFEKRKRCLLVYFVSNLFVETSRHSETLSHRERFDSHVRWKVEFVWFATTSNALVFFSWLWQMQSRKQMWFHTKSHYVILSCNEHICFEIDQIRNICINSCSRKRFASIFDLVTFDFIYLFFFSICFDAFLFLDIFAFIFCLQTLSRTFRHLLIYWLSHANCLKSWKQWNIHETALLKFRFFSLYFEKVLISSREITTLKKLACCCLFVLLVLSISINRWSIMIWKNIKVVVVLMNSMFRLFRSFSIWESFKSCCMLCFIV